jgi:hypothetical protein
LFRVAGGAFGGGGGTLLLLVLALALVLVLVLVLVLALVIVLVLVLMLVLVLLCSFSSFFSLLLLQSHLITRHFVSFPHCHRSGEHAVAAVSSKRGAVPRGCVQRERLDDDRDGVLRSRLSAKLHGPGLA